MALLFGGVEPFMKIGHHREQECEVILNLNLWFKKRCHLKKKFTHNGRTKTDHNSSPWALVS